MRLAITTSNGEMVDLHFGKADTFYVYEISNSGLSFVGKRKVTPYCSSAAMPDDGHVPSEDRFNNVVETIKDCKVLYTKQIGDAPIEKLRQNGIAVQLCHCSVESIFGCNCDCNCGHN